MSTIFDEENDDDDDGDDANNDDDNAADDDDVHDHDDHRIRTSASVYLRRRMCGFRITSIRNRVKQNVAVDRGRP